MFVFVIGVITYLILQTLIIAIFGIVYGLDVIPLITGGYETLNSELGIYIGSLSIVIFIPSI